MNGDLQQSRRQSALPGRHPVSNALELNSRVREPGTRVGGLNLARSTDGEQIEAEDDYRDSARCGSGEECKPKKRRRKMKTDDEHAEES